LWFEKELISLDPYIVPFFVIPILITRTVFVFVQVGRTGLLNISLLQAAATPVGIWAIFSRHAGTPLTVKGFGTGNDEVSVSPLISISKGAGGLMAKAMVVGRKYPRCEEKVVEVEYSMLLNEAISKVNRSNRRGEGRGRVFAPW
jgi:hypothetical protein